MPTTTGHTRAILASKVNGTAVYNSDGDKIGHIEDVVLDKLSNNIMFAVIGFGGVLGVGEKYHPVPWSVLDYNPEKGGYLVRMSKEELQNSPAYDVDDLIEDDGTVRAETYTYYNAQQYW